MKKAARIIGILVILSAFVPLSIAALWYKKTEGFIERAVKTEARVVHVEERRSDDGTMHYPVFSFEDENGITHKIYSKMGSRPPSRNIGDTVMVFYDPRNPAKMKIDSFVSLWLGPAIFAGLGLIPLGFGALIFLAGPLVIGAIMEETQKQSTSLPAPEDRTKEKDKQDRTWAMFCHLSTLSALIGIPFGNIIGPLVIWLIKREEFSFVDAHGKESLNFQISLTIYSLVAFLLCFAFIGFILLPAVLIFGLCFVIVATVKANGGEEYRYPLTIRFIK